MSKLSVIVYTMKGCPHCKDFKELLLKEGIEFHDRDIDEYEEESIIFSKVTNNDMIPALLVIEGDLKKHKSFLYVPEKNYNELTEAVEIIRGHQKKMGIL